MGARTRPGSTALVLASAVLGLLCLGVALRFILTTGIPTWAWYALPWLAAVATGLALVPHRPGHEALGLAILSVPVWDTSLGILASFEQLVAGGATLLPLSTFQLSGLYSYKLVSDLGYLGVGFLIFVGGNRILSLTPATVARRLAATGFPLAGRTEGHSILLGLVLFPVLLAVTILVNQGLSGFQALRQSDETSLFANMTPYHALLISLAAAFGEELVYRGLVQTALARRLPMVGAIVVQALFFGFAHSGYATWIHVLLPTLFGLVAGLVAWRLGIWAAIVLHAFVDIYAFGVEASANYAWVLPVLNALLLANLVLTVGWGIWWLLQRFRPNPAN